MAAAFASPGSAVDAAIVAQREVQLPVRMGIATGEAELRDNDYFGTVLNRAARVMAAGHGGQILVAESTAGLLSGVELMNLGPRRLRDVANPITVFQLRAPGLRADFPPLRALDTSPGNLRPATTSFIGRDSEVAEINEAVRAHRLVTLTGVGGVGKTRLALEVAAQLGDEFPDGVWLFELAAVTDPAAVPDAVAAVLGITQQPGKTVTESVAAALEGRVRLLVFDNCEHVLDAAADLVEAILAQSATVKVLATSREGLGVADEQVWRGAIVGCRYGGGPVRRACSQCRAELFGRRADAVEEICGRLDGIPLAIELAASRMASMTAGEVRDRLDQRFRLLVGSRRGLERHQTLRHAVQWSYDLLDDAEKTLLDRCSVFAGGFDLESACAVAGSDDTDDFAVLDLLDALVRKSLLVADRSTGHTRYSMLETIRQFAEEQLAARGASGRGPHRACPPLRRARSRHPGAVGQPSPAGGLRLVHRRAGQPAHRVPMGRRPRRPRRGRRHRDLRRLCRDLVENYEPMRGPRNSSSLRAPSTIPGSRPCTQWRRMCCMVGRIDEAVGYSDAGQNGSRCQRSRVPTGCASRARSALRTCASASPNGAVSGTAVSWQRWSRHSSLTRACSGPRTGDSPDRADEAMAAAERPGRRRRSHPAIPIRSRSRCSPTACAYHDADPPAHLNAFAGVSRSRKTAATGPTRHIWRSLWHGSRGVGAATQWSRSTTPRWRSVTYHDSGNPTHPRRPGCARPRLRSARTPRTGGHHRRLRVRAHDRGVVPEISHRDRPPTRGPRRHRPTSRSPAMVRR